MLPVNVTMYELCMSLVENGISYRKLQVDYMESLVQEGKSYLYRNYTYSVNMNCTWNVLYCKWVYCLYVAPAPLNVCGVQDITCHYALT